MIGIRRLVFAGPVQAAAAAVRIMFVGAFLEDSLFSAFPLAPSFCVFSAPLSQCSLSLRGVGINVLPV